MLWINVITAFITFSFCPEEQFEGWSTLSKLKIVLRHDEILNEEFELPVFSDDLQAFDGQQIGIEGYVIPLETTKDQRYFVLSRYPYNNCFFCGNAGPETVAEVYASHSVPAKEQKVRVTGLLKLNATDPLHLFYIIKDAEVEMMK